VSPNQAEILALIAAGYTNAAIARERASSVRSVEMIVAQDVSVVVVGVSLSLSSVTENINLARDRAQGISQYLQDQGVAGEYTVTISTRFTVDAAERSAGSLRSVDLPPSGTDNLEDPVESSKGKPLTTASISFEAPQKT